MIRHRRAGGERREGCGRIQSGGFSRVTGGAPLLPAAGWGGVAAIGGGACQLVGFPACRFVGKSESWRVGGWAEEGGRSGVGRLAAIRGGLQCWWVVRGGGYRVGGLAAIQGVLPRYGWWAAEQSTPG